MLSRRRDKSKDPDDPFNLRRFTREQASCFHKALCEIRKGRKSSCWMWYVIPTPPYFVNGVEMGSFTNKLYALRGECEAHAYLTFERDGVSLRRNYLEMMQAVRDQLRVGIPATSLMGMRDEPKLVSSVKFFERCTRTAGDDIHAVCIEVLKLLRTTPVPETHSFFHRGRAFRQRKGSTIEALSRSPSPSQDNGRPRSVRVERTPSDITVVRPRSVSIGNGMRAVTRPSLDVTPLRRGKVSPRPELKTATIQVSSPRSPRSPSPKLGDDCQPVRPRWGARLATTTARPLAPKVRCRSPRTLLGT